MNKKPLISIITPSFNQGRYIAETIESVLSQTYDNIEYLVMDGGSNDETIGILRKYEGVGLKWVSEPDNGQSDAIQKGFEWAQGEIIGWLNSDDVLLPATVEKIVCEFNKSPEIGMVCGDVLVIDDSGCPITIWRSPSLSLYRLLNEDESIIQPGSFYRKNFVDKVGGIDKELKFVMDYDLFIRLLRVSNVAILAEPLAKFRLHAESKSCTLMPIFGVIEAFRVRRRWGAPLLSRLNAHRISRLLKELVKRALGMPAINIAKIRNRMGSGENS